MNDPSSAAAPHPFARTRLQGMMLHAPNLLVRAILRSPAHRLLSNRVLLLTYTGRRTATAYTIPVQYVAERDTLRVKVGVPERKLWWRNLRRPATAVRVRLRLRGRDLAATAEVRERDDAVTVILTPIGEAARSARP